MSTNPHHACDDVAPLTDLLHFTFCCIRRQHLPSQLSQSGSALGDGDGLDLWLQCQCLACRKPAGAQGHSEDCRLWTSAGDSIPAPFHRLCLHQMVRASLPKEEHACGVPASSQQALNTNTSVNYLLGGDIGFWLQGSK